MSAAQGGVDPSFLPPLAWRTVGVASAAPLTPRPMYSMDSASRARAGAENALARACAARFQILYREFSWPQKAGLTYLLKSLNCMWLRT